MRYLLRSLPHGAGQLTLSAQGNGLGFLGTEGQAPLGSRYLAVPQLWQLCRAVPQRCKARRCHGGLPQYCLQEARETRQGWRVDELSQGPAHTLPDPCHHLAGGLGHQAAIVGSWFPRTEDGRIVFGQIFYGDYTIDPIFMLTFFGAVFLLYRGCSSCGKTSRLARGLWS